MNFNKPKTEPTYRRVVFLTGAEYNYFIKFGKEEVGMSGRKYLVVKFPGAEFKIYQDSEKIEFNINV
jgi:hypothetical protein